MMMDDPFFGTTVADIPLQSQDTMESRLSREILRVVELTAMTAARHMGLGDTEKVDAEATLTMQKALAQVNMTGEIVIGDNDIEDQGIQVGDILGSQAEGTPKVDLAIDPVEGKNLVAKGLPNAITAIAVSEKQGLLRVPKTYMKKLIAGPAAKGRLDINAPVQYNLNILALSLEREITDITVVILDRPRHEELIQEVRSCGARIKLIRDGDVLPAIASALKDTGIHAVMGIGGSSEGILAAAALKCLGGEIQAQFCWRNETEKAEAEAQGLSTSEDMVYFTEDLVPANELVFAAGGITTGETLKGVRFFGGGVRTNSLITAYASGMVRFVDTVHLTQGRRTAVKLGP